MKSTITWFYYPVDLAEAKEEVERLYKRNPYLQDSDFRTLNHYPGKG